MIRRLVLTLSLTGCSTVATEEPPFEVSLREGAFEVRDYPAMIAAEVTVGGERGSAVNAGFRLLAGYIFGGNTRRQSIAMTAPVVQAQAEPETIAMTAPVIQSGGPSAWVIRFIMPRAYSLATLPAPNDARVRLTPVPASRMAVVRFSGLGREEDIKERTGELEAFVAANRLRAAGPPSLARYNPPWTPWFMRRNEVMIPLEVETGR